MLEAGEASSYSDISQQKKRSGFLSSKSKSQRDAFEDTSAIATTLSGESVTLVADRDIAIKGSNVAATNDATLIAGRNMAIEAAQESHNETHEKRTTQSGVFGSGGVGFTLGSRMNSSDQQTEATTAAKSTVGSVEGNVTLLAGEKYRQVGSDVIAVQGDIDIAAKQVDIVEARETSRTTTETRSKQSGLTIAITSPVITAIQTAQQMSDAAKDTSDSRMKALAAASTGLAGYNAANAIAEAGSVTGGVNLVISIGGSKSSSQTTQTSDTAAVSNLSAGRDIRIEASGDGKNSDAPKEAPSGGITLQGTQANAARNLALAADDEIKLLAATNTANQKSKNQNASGSVGISIGTNTGFTVGASAGRGKADGDDLVHTNTRIEAAETLTLQSGGDTTLQGAVAKGEKVIAEIGGPSTGSGQANLKIESLQDTSTYDSKQKSLGGSITIGTGGVTGSVSASNSKVQSDYASVTEQSAIRAGNKGFDVRVEGDTDLKGGAITSTQKAIDDARNRFVTGGELSLSDIHNKAEYEGKAISVNIGAGFSAKGELTPQGTSAGFGKTEGKAESMTLAAISGIAGNKDARTGDRETGIKPIFDRDRVQKEIDAQVRITQVFGQLAPKAAADFAGKQAADLRKQGNEEEAKKWEEGGAYRIALHTLIGGLAGGTGGAVGAAASAAAAPLLNELQEGIAKALKDAGANDSVAKLAGQLITGTTAAGIGAAVGGTGGAVTAFNADANNRQLHATEAKLIKDNAAKYAARRGISLEQAEAELTQQAMQQTDSAWDERLGADNNQAQAFLNEIGAGTTLTDLQTGQRYQLFSADQATRDNHAIFAQFAKADPQVRRELDLAMSEAYRPKDGQTLDQRGMSGSDMALNDAARDYGNMKSQPADVQWAVLGELRQTRQQNQQVIAQLAKEYSNLPLSPESTQKRGELQTQIETLQQRDQALLGSIKAQLLDMGSGGSGLLIPGKYREWTEGFGEARSLAGLNFKGMSHAGIGAKINMLKGAVQEIKAVAEAERAAQRASNASDIESAFYRDAPLVPEPRSLTNIQTRDWYNAKMEYIDAVESQLRANGASSKDIFEVTTRLRNEIKVQAREFMADQELAKSLPPPKAPEDILRRYGGNYDDAIAASKRPNENVNQEIERRRFSGEH
ncbi:MAG: hemagglutinin repeat-containing protein [Betaproteobacteria bacterium]|nr:hemagglutinin repeat-containing protein [Betaproteobacteria bacterium]